METRRMCPHCRAFITTSDRVCPYCNERVGPPAAARRSSASTLGGFVPHASFTTVMILLVNFAMFAATTLYSMQSDIPEGETLRRFGAKVGVDIVFGGQWWRLVTAGFLHGGLLHIFMNSFALFDLGAQVEDIYGPRRMIVFYFAATVFGFLCSTYVSPYSLSVGASAGLFGLIGAMIALGVRQRSTVGDAIRGLYIRWAVYGLLLGLLPGLRVDNAAHIGGLAAGFGAAYMAGTPGFAGSWSERFWTGAAYLCVLLTAVSFLKMFLWFSSVEYK